MFTTEINNVQSVLDLYFQGIFSGDTAMLEQAFHPQALLFGDIDGAAYFKTLGDYLENVRNRQSPQEKGETLRMKTLGIDILGRNAIARLHVPMLGYNYYDSLSLSKTEERWQIVNKLFSNMPTAP